MAKKAPRAENVRKLTGDEARVLEPKGGTVDESIPKRARSVMEARSAEADPALLAEFLGARLGRYRNACQDEAQRLSVTREIAITSETVELIAELTRRLERMPDLIQARADEVMWKARGELWFTSSQRLVANLNDSQAILSMAMKKSEIYKGSAGDKPSWARDALVRDVVAKITELSPPRTKKGQIAVFAHQLIGACGVELPVDIEDFKKLVRKTGKD